MSEIGMKKSELRIPEKAGGIRLRGSFILFSPCPPKSSIIDPCFRPPNVDRLIAAIRGEKTDRVPNFESRDRTHGRAETRRALYRRLQPQHRELHPA